MIFLFVLIVITMASQFTVFAEIEKESKDDTKDN